MMFYCLFFFFQAEDGIRDLYVTGVQTCALPIFHGADWPSLARRAVRVSRDADVGPHGDLAELAKQIGLVRTLNEQGDRKSTRLNSSHVEISYAVFCLKKKNKTQTIIPPATLAIT